MFLCTESCVFFFCFFFKLAVLKLVLVAFVRFQMSKEYILLERRVKFQDKPVQGKLLFPPSAIEKPKGIIPTTASGATYSNLCVCE